MTRLARHRNGLHETQGKIVGPEFDTLARGERGAAKIFGIIGGDKAYPN